MKLSEEAIAKIREAFIKKFGDKDLYLGEPGSWFIEGYKSCLIEQAAQCPHLVTDKESTAGRRGA